MLFVTIMVVTVIGIVSLFAVVRKRGQEKEEPGIYKIETSTCTGNCADCDHTRCEDHGFVPEKSFPIEETEICLFRNDESHAWILGHFGGWMRYPAAPFYTTDFETFTQVAPLGGNEHCEGKVCEASGSYDYDTMVDEGFI